MDPLNTALPVKSVSRQIVDSVVSFARAYDICPEGDFRGRERIAELAERDIRLILLKNGIKLPEENQPSP